jgi:hypothetical protein
MISRSRVLGEDLALCRRSQSLDAIIHGVTSRVVQKK